MKRIILFLMLNVIVVCDANNSEISIDSFDIIEKQDMTNREYLRELLKSPESRKKIFNVLNTSMIISLLGSFYFLYRDGSTRRGWSFLVLGCILKLFAAAFDEKKEKADGPLLGVLDQAFILGYI